MQLLAIPAGADADIMHEALTDLIPPGFRDLSIDTLLDDPIAGPGEAAEVSIVPKPVDAVVLVEQPLESAGPCTRKMR